MTTEAGRFQFNVMCRGHVLGIYRSWEECEQQVNGFRNNEHHGFHDLSEALAWLPSAASPPARQPTPHVQLVRRRSSRLLEGAFCSIPSSQQASSVIVAADSQHFGDGSGCSNPTGMNVVEPGEDDRFVYVEDMEFMLMQEINSNDERVLFGFTVVLPHNGRDLDLVAHGRLCYEECVAHQEVSFTMLDKILGATGYTVYNYHILGRVKERLNQ
ncbi:hypothetical protein Ahy_B10g105187 [Arachis hypogaea]|uniref:Ribonuclease H1 N-terminal domain-containing protein n=1 Tax=Arachis hypogaea TaxID=3818 RepID=A0A444X7H0_ARAHY|nr:hypothetical protein Ahy_B10g105187 [Arachis hypogaea]